MRCIAGRDMINYTTLNPGDGGILDKLQNICGSHFQFLNSRERMALIRSLSIQLCMEFSDAEYNLELNELIRMANGLSISDRIGLIRCLADNSIIPTMEKKMEIKKECLDNSREICQGMNVENFIPYMPSNGTEGSYFEASWCERCARNHDCDIIIQAYCGEQPPEWIYFDNKPMCIKWEKKSSKPDILSAKGKYRGILGLEMEGGSKKSGYQLTPFLILYLQIKDRMNDGAWITLSSKRLKFPIYLQELNQEFDSLIRSIEDPQYEDEIM